MKYIILLFMGLNLFIACGDQSQTTSPEVPERTEETTENTNDKPIIQPPVSFKKAGPVFETELSFTYSKENIYLTVSLYQDNANKNLWYCLPTSFEVATKFDPELGQERASFRHTFFDKVNNPFSFYQFIFNPSFISEKVENSIKDFLTSKRKNTLMTSEIILERLIITDLDHRVHIFTNIPERKKYNYTYQEKAKELSVYGLPNYFPVELQILSDDEPWFSESLLSSSQENPFILGFVKMTFQSVADENTKEVTVEGKMIVRNVFEKLIDPDLKKFVEKRKK